MLEGSIVLLLIGCIGVLYLIIKWFQVVGESIEDSAKERQFKKRQKKGHFHFERKNEVEGILSVDGKEIKTYNIGELELDEIIVFHFYDSPYSKEIRITDILFNGKSIYLFTTGTWKEKADYAIVTLKTMADNKVISPSLAREVQEIILEVEELNKYLETGSLVRTTDDGFAWVF